ncbi:vacuolar sorting protein 39 domain 2-domain-containing protein [Spinellus fusiger]|nr:vacuolar sorting protein 39 domain 2-domain-containing protein [Spinellus fusiger]
MWIKKRLMLIKLLQRSPFYSAEDLLKVLSDNKQLNIEQVIVYGRMGMHTEALYILIYDLGDFTGAETYCVTSGQSVGTIIDLVQTQSTQLQPTRSSSLAANKHYKSSDTKKEREYTQKMSRMDMMLKKLSKEELEERRTLFSTLLKTYLAIQDSQIMLSRTVHLLNTQGFYLDMSKVLSSISDEWPIEILQDFLTKSLRRSLHVYRQSNIVVGLSRGENVMVGSQLIEIYNDIGPIYVDEQSLCKKCNRYLGDTVFVRNNDRGQLLHIHCAKILGLIDSDENSS